MPLFEPDEVHAFVGNVAKGDRTLDLRGLSLHDAQSKLSWALNYWQRNEKIRLVVRIDPATATSGETLFLPIGRQLLEAKRHGRISRVQPLPEADGGGFYVELPGRARGLGKQR